MPEQDPIDRLIDSALATYADAGATSELPRGVLERISAEAPPAPRRRWLLWAIALPVAAALLIFAVLSGLMPGHRPGGNTEQAKQSQGPAAVTRSDAAIAPRTVSAARTRAAIPKLHRRLVAAAAKPAPLPKLDVFPTPEPLTPVEQALVAYVAHAPETERRALVASQEQVDQPLNIAAIGIQPLEIQSPGPPEPDGN